MILVQYSNISILNVEYQKAKEFKSTENSTLLSEKLKGLDGVTRICPAIIKDTLKGSL